MKKCIALVLVLLALVCCAAADEPRTPDDIHSEVYERVKHLL